jgi:hypothetical protein
MNGNSAHGTPRIEIDGDAPAILKKTETEDIKTAIDEVRARLSAATRFTFGARDAARELSPPDIRLMVEVADVMGRLSMVELEALYLKWMLTDTVAEGGGGHK